MRNLTATLCLTIATLFISATAEKANAEDKFYAYDKNNIGSVSEVILSIKGKNLEIDLSTTCDACLEPYLVYSMMCQKTKIGPKNTFRSICTNKHMDRRLEGNLEKAKLGGDANVGDHVFQFIPFSQKKAFETYRKKTAAISTSEFFAALPAQQKAERERQRKFEIARVESARKNIELEHQRKSELARQRAEAERQRIAEEARLAAVEKKRLAELARQRAEAERQRIAEEARLAAVEKKRLAAIAQAEEEQRVYEELSGAARQYLTTVQRYLVDNPTTPLLMEIITASSSINTSLKNESVTGVTAGLETLKATLSRTKGYSNYVAVLEEKRRARLAAEARIRREKLAAEVREKREDLGSYIAFVKRQIIQNLNINPGLTFALIPLAKELHDGMDSKDPVLLASLRNRAAAALEKYALTEQYAQVERAMKGTVADGRFRNRAAPAQTHIDISKKINRDVSFDDIRFGNYYALVIGNNNYSHMGKLKTAINDATEVAQVLRRAYGFKVNLLTDATRAEMILSLSKLRATLKFDDNLLIYYAGHGILDEIGEQGYWLPVDAEQGNPTNWISVGDITVMLRAIRAKHVLVIADSCYSGTLVRSGAAQPRTAKEKYAWIKRISGKRSRVALVSGGLEPVVDGGGGGKHSVFANAVINALKRNTGVIEGQELFDQIKRPVVLNADQTPSYSDIRKTGHDGGGFILVRRPTP